ncbi:MAG TPA: stage II sporulation protein M [Candidatus Aminicenantes bacterium]|nr:stage II sporulation protein M [Candidatus Aminicenantes bacterium]HRY63897.1 stage II sporulation protein M [Candidatus Aminicenantes bacterium]HRZ70810.1 stage II sporulation protein M [Candidatus Aminicenantes bacterium]
MTSPEIRPRTGEPASVPPNPGRPPGPVRRLYLEERLVWRRHYRRYFKHAARALGLGFVAGFIYFMLWPAREKKALEFVIRSLKDIPLQASPLVLSLTLFYHNTRASILAVAAGLVPCAFLPIFDPVINGAVLGLLCSFSQHQGLNVPRLVLTQILPHGVIELAAVLYATSVGLHLSASLGLKVRAAWKARKRARSEGRAGEPQPADAAGEAGPKTAAEEAAEGQEGGGLFRDVVRSFVLVVIPLLLVAAFIEGFITPLLR